MKEKKNICKYCGGELLVEIIGNYGNVYKLRQNGEIPDRRLRRNIYPEDMNNSMTYCSKCGKAGPSAI